MSIELFKPIGLGGISCLYNVEPEYIHYRSRTEIIKALMDYGAALMETEEDDFRRYMLKARLDLLCEEVHAARPGGLYEALVGMSYIAPYALASMFRDESDALHVFLARDAASDYITADLMDKLDIRKNDSTIAYISRNTLDEAYRIVAGLVATVQDVEKLDEIMFTLYATNQQYKQRIDRLIMTLRDCGSLDRQNVQYFDSWAEGTIFTIISFAHKVAQLNGMVSVENQVISYATMNNKSRLRVVKTDFDYDNVVSSLDDPYKVPEEFYESFQRAAKQSPYVPITSASYVADQSDINLWYAHESMAAPIIAESQDYVELMTARIYKPHNHFGSLNLGHPFEWDGAKGLLKDASPDKKIGNLLRQLVIINSVIGHRDGYKINLDTAPKNAPLIKVDTRADLAPLATLFGDENGAALDVLIRTNSEHFVTSASSAAINLCSNLCTMMQLFKQSTVLSVSSEQNYDFQFFCNGIKKYQPTDFSQRLTRLIEIFDPDTCRKLFKTSPVAFLDSIKDIYVEEDIMNRSINCFVFDIDGTVTPTEDAIPMFVDILRSKRSLGFITGRPLGYCKEMLSQIFAILSLPEIELYKDKIMFYAAHGSQILFGDSGTELSSFDHSQFTTIDAFANANGLQIVSRRDYRLMLQPIQPSLNPNSLRWSALQLDQLLSGKAGVYLAKWHKESSINIDATYNAIDVCSNKRTASLNDICRRLKDKDNTIEPSNILYIADEPELADNGMLANGISVRGFGLVKTKKVVERILRGRL